MEQCRVCGKPEIDKFWSGMALKYCSFSCQAYAWRYGTTILLLLFVLIVIINPNLLYFLFIILLTIYSISGFSVTIDKHNETVGQDNGYNSNKGSSFKEFNSQKESKSTEIPCKDCGGVIFEEDKYCPVCGTSTNDSLLKYYNSKFNL